MLMTVMHRIIDNKMIHSDGNLYRNICYLKSTICIAEELHYINYVTIHSFWFFFLLKKTGLSQEQYIINVLECCFVDIRAVFQFKLSQSYIYKYFSCCCCCRRCSDCDHLVFTYTTVNKAKVICIKTNIHFLKIFSII